MDRTCVPASIPNQPIKGWGYMSRASQCETFYVPQAKLRDEAYAFSSIYYKTITSYYLKIKTFRLWDDDDYEYEI